MKIYVVWHPWGDRWFGVIAQAMCGSLTTLGHEVVPIHAESLSTLNDLPPGTALVVAPHVYGYRPESLNFTYRKSLHTAGWCLEQTPYIGFENAAVNDVYEASLRYINRFDTMFTESDAKTDYLKWRAQCNAKTLNMGWHELFDLKVTPKKKIYDAYMLGVRTPRREKILQEAHQAGLRIYVNGHAGIFDPAEKAMITSITKVGLNVHNNDNLYFEKPRIIQDYMSNGLMVVSEDIRYPESLVNGVHLTMVPHDQVVVELQRVLTQSDQYREDFANRALEHLKTNYTMLQSAEHFVKTMER